MISRDAIINISSKLNQSTAYFWHKKTAADRADTAKEALEMIAHMEFSLERYRVLVMRCRRLTEKLWSKYCAEDPESTDDGFSSSIYLIAYNILHSETSRAEICLQEAVERIASTKDYALADISAVW